MKCLEQYHVRLSCRLPAKYLDILHCTVHVSSVLFMTFVFFIVLVQLSMSMSNRAALETLEKEAIGFERKDQVKWLSRCLRVRLEITGHLTGRNGVRFSISFCDYRMQLLCQ